MSATASGSHPIDPAVVVEAALALPVDARESLIRRLAWTIPIESRRDLAEREFSPAVLDKARRAERAQLVLAMADGMRGSINARAETIHRQLLRYASSAWPHDCRRDVPANIEHRLAHRVLILGDGEVPSTRSLRRLSWPKGAVEMAKSSCDGSRGRKPKEVQSC